MTNTTGPAQQRDQPTQLTADEAAELDELIRELTAAKWQHGFENGLHLDPSRPERAAEKAAAEEESDRALLAIHAWLHAHAPKPEESWREVPAVTP